MYTFQFFGKKICGVLLRVLAPVLHGAGNGHAHFGAENITHVIRDRASLRKVGDLHLSLEIDKHECYSLSELTQINIENRRLSMRLFYTCVYIYQTRTLGGHIYKY